MPRLQPLLALATFLLALTAAAQTAPLSLQGKLTGVPDGEQDLTLLIWDVAQGGTPVASVPFRTQVDRGLFSAIIETPATAFNGDERWWSVLASAGETARQRVASVPHAAVASIMVGARGVPALPELDPVRDAIDPTAQRAWITAPLAVVSASPFPPVLAVGPGQQLLGQSFLPGEAQFFPVVGTGFQRSTGFGFYSNWYTSGLANSDAASAVVWIRDGFNNVFDVVKAEPTLPLSAANWLLRVSVSGATNVRTLAIHGGSDLAEPFPSSPSSQIRATPGMVLSIDPEHPGALRVSTTACDTTVAGVYSGANGLPTGMLMGKDGCDLTAPGEDRLPLAMTGRVWVYACDSNGDIRPGDRLTTSGAKPGHAMRVSDETQSIGAVIGKAMTTIDPDTGMVLVLVNLH